MKPEQFLQFKTASAVDVTVQLQNGQQVAAQGANPVSLQARSSTAATGEATKASIDLPNQADPATFEIVSLKLGMTAKEADAILYARFPAMQKGYAVVVMPWPEKPDPATRIPS